MTLARAIAAVGGTTAHAAEHRVEVLRVRGGRVERLRYSLPASGQAITLQPGDSVVVPTEANPFGEPPPPDDEVDLAVERSR
jgi:protein involved in polysaccharide export with SLBB domain